jgi:hypothetical protein
MIKGLRDKLDLFKRKASRQSVKIARILMEELLQRTPVWTGSTVASFATGLNAIPRGDGVTIEPDGSEGPTNSMGIGEEPRRGTAEAIAWANFDTATAGTTTLSNIYISNTSPTWALVDAGQAPGGPNQRIRAPGGVAIRSVQAAKARLRGTVK